MAFENTCAYSLGVDVLVGRNKWCFVQYRKAIFGSYFNTEVHFYISGFYCNIYHRTINMDFCY